MDQRRATLEDAITVVAAQAKSQGVSLTRTKLVKLLFFVDLVAWESLGRTITGVEWIWHNYGPYSGTIIEAVSSMAASDELKLEQTVNYFGSPEYRVSSSAPIMYRPASSDLAGLVRRVVREYGKLSPSAIGDASYETAPMRELITRGGRRGDRIDFSSSPPPKNDVRSAVAKYRGLMKKRSDEGDVAGGLRSELEATDGARRSSNSALLPHG